jgi:D-amino-acid dehydrogenase
MKDVAIIGGGVIGLCSAYYLERAGHRVTVFDQGDLIDNCSSGNAGMVVPSHIIPLAAPGMMAKGIRWMFDEQSPFYVRPRLNLSLLRWGYQFYKHANHRHVQHAIPALKAISLFSKSMYQQMVRDNPFDFGYHEKGLLMLYQTAETEKEEAEAAAIANQHGIEAHILSPREVQKLEPEVEVSVRGAVYFPGDAHLIPQQFITNLTAHLQSKGVKIERHTPVSDFSIQQNRVVSVMLPQGERHYDEYVLATGAWSAALGARLGLDLPLQGGKGYSFTLEPVQQVHIPSILLEGRVAVTPMAQSLRFGGTMEIDGTNRSVNMKRVQGIVDTIPKYYPGLSVKLPEQKNVWRGLRPCSPDGLPYIGRPSHLQNLVIATGHAMMGLSLAPGTGKVVSQLISEETPGVPLDAFNPNRYTK